MGSWRFNVPVLWDQYPHIVGWEKIPAWITLPCLSLVVILRMLAANSTVMIYWHNFHRHGRMSLQARVTGRTSRETGCGITRYPSLSQ